MRAALSSIVREPLTWFMMTAVAIGIAAAGFVVAIAPEASASAPITVTDTVLNIERWVNPNGDRLAAVRPDGWAQPVYYIWLSQECAATVRLGDPWPSANPICGAR